jgi:hypothetical protein
VWIVLHISLTVNMHTKTYCTYCYHHSCTLCIKTQKPFNCYSMSTKPTSQRNNNSRSHRPNFIKNKKTEYSTCTLTKNGHTSTSSCPKHTAHQPSQSTPQKRRKNSIQIHFRVLYYMELILY